jgi:hypothetical protein
MPLAGALWFALYQTLIPFSEAVVAQMPVTRDSHLGDALQFFFYDTPKVLLLLTGIVSVTGIVHTFVSPERTRALLSGRRLGTGNVMAASLGIVTPFYSCSAVPLFIGFLQAGVPLGVTFSFLIWAVMRPGFFHQARGGHHQFHRHFRLHFRLRRPRGGGAAGPDSDCTDLGCRHRRRATWRLVHGQTCQAGLGKTSLCRAAAGGGGEIAVGHL